MVLDELDETFVGFCFRNALLDKLFANVEVHSARPADDVAEVGISHFTGAIHDTPHDCDLHTGQMLCPGADARRSGLKSFADHVGFRARHHNASWLSMNRSAVVDS
jgi:hypothetical protein